MDQNTESAPVKTRYESSRTVLTKPLGPGDIVWESTDDGVKPVQMKHEPEGEWMRFDMRPMNYRAAIRRCKRTRFMAMRIVFTNWRLKGI